MKKVKQIFPSRNYITIDTTGDIEIIFNPVGDGFEGDDKLQFRRGRWAFRCNDFLAGKMLPNGENENMNRKIYSLNIVYDTENGEPIVNTTYVDPTSVIPLDGSLVSGNWLTVSDIANLATVAKQNEIKNAIQGIDFSELATVEKQSEISTILNSFYTNFGLLNKKIMGVSDFFNSSGTLLVDNLPNGNYKHKGTLLIELVFSGVTYTLRITGAVLDICINDSHKNVFLRGYDSLYLISSDNRELFSNRGYLFEKDYLARFTLPNSVEVNMYTNEDVQLTLAGNGNFSIF